MIRFTHRRRHHHHKQQLRHSHRDRRNHRISPGSFSAIGFLASLLTLNPIAKLTAEDFSGETPSWTVGFFGVCESNSFPNSAAQAKPTVCENVKRFARNYAYLFIVAFACTLYQMPFALAGLIACLAMWDLLKVLNDRAR